MASLSSPWPEIARSISSHTGKSFSIGRHVSLGGGCISSAWRIDDETQSYFVKLNDVVLLDMFVAEADGLRALDVESGPRIPVPICHGVAGDQSFLVLEYIQFGSTSIDSDSRLGEQLACLHQLETPHFGWHRDNHIGSTPQCNTASNDWVRFFSEQRLGKQLSFAAANGFSGELQELGHELIERLPDLFTDYQPGPVVLHGDLWGGNHGVDAEGCPVIFDPAVYFGDRETDLAMTELFGGFGAGFYAAYNAALPLDAGFGVRKSLYNLYHIINHLNLFGEGYLGQALAMQQHLLSELR